MFVGLLGQIVLQGFALPGATPRATLLRLTGVDIGQLVSAADPGTGSEAHSDSGSMAMMGHTMMAHRAVAASSASKQKAAPVSHHQHDETCSLCPLLVLFAVILAALPVMPGLASLWLAIRRRFAAPRAPPLFALRVLPPSRAPPFLPV